MKDSWKKQKLIDLVIGKGEYGINAAACEYNPKFYTYLRITDVSEDGRFLEKGKKSVNNIEAEKFILKNGDITFARTGASTGKTYLYNPKDGKLVFAGFLIRFRPNSEKLNSTFLKYITQSYIYKSWVSIYSARTGQPGINGNEFGEFMFDLPPLQQQQKIAKILSTCDEIIEKTEAAIAKYQALKQGMMHDLFTRGIDVKTGKLRPNYQDAPELYKESELGMIPKDWEVKRLGEIGEVITGSTPSTKNDKYYEGNFMFISPADVSDRKIIDKSIKSLTELGLSVSRNIPKSSICVVCIGSTIGKIGMTTQLCTTNQQINSIVPNEVVIADFLFYASKYFLNKQLSIEAGLQAVPIVNKTSFEKLIIPIATIKKEAIQIGERLNIIDSKLQTEQTVLAKYQQLKAGLMQDLLTGKVAVSVE